MADNLTQQFTYQTKHDIVSAILTNDGSQIIYVLKVSDEEYQVVQMSAQLYTELSTRVLSGHYIKAKQVVQNNAGNLYMIPYYDNGIFRLTVFNKDKDLDEININEILKIDNTSRPNHGLPDPMMNACFV